MSLDMAGNQVVYVISAREMISANGETEDWQVLQVVSINYCTFYGVNAQRKLRSAYNNIFDNIVCIYLTD